VLEVAAEKDGQEVATQELRGKMLGQGFEGGIVLYRGIIGS